MEDGLIRHDKKWVELNKDRLDAEKSDVLNAAITGGAGLPLERGPHLAGIFTLHQDNTNYLTGKSTRPKREFGGSLLVLLFFLIFLLVASQAFSAPQHILAYIVISCFCLVAIYLAIDIIRKLLFDRAFALRGILLLGQVVSAAGKWHTTTDDIGSSTDYRVTVSYRVALPDGTKLNGTEKADRNDLSKGPLPKPGDLVAVRVLPASRKTRVL